MRKVERVEVDGMVVVTAADSSLTSRANIRAQVKAAAERARARVARSRDANEATGQQPSSELQAQES